MNSFDYIVIAIIVISTLFAFFNGFLRTFFSLLGWIVAAVISIYALPYTAPIAEKYVNNEILANMFATTGSFISAAIVMAIFNMVILSFLSNLRGGFFDRLLGLLFGFARGTIFVLIIFFATYHISPMLFKSSNVKSLDDEIEQTQSSKEEYLPKFLTNAATYDILKKSHDTVIYFVPEYITDSIAFERDNLKDNLKDLSTIKKLIDKSPYDDEAEIDIDKLVDDAEAGNLLKDDVMKEQIREILDTYQNAVSDGLIDPEEEIDEEALKELEKRLDR